MATFNIAHQTELITQLINSGQYEAAKKKSRNLIMKAPTDSTGYTLLASVYYKTKHWLEAERCCRRAIELGNDVTAFTHIFGAVLTNVGKLDEAQQILEDEFNRTGELVLLCDIATVQHFKGNYSEALEIYDKFLEFKPDHACGLFNRGILALFLGKFDVGWSGYAERFRASPEMYLRTEKIAPDWNGESFNGKRVLIWFEQGIGDSLVFAACIDKIVAATKSCGVICDPRLRRLFSVSFPKAHVIQTDEQLTEIRANSEIYDFQLHCGSLMEVFYSSEIRKASKPYLHVEPYGVEKIKQEFDSTKQINVGISWFGGAAKNSNNRWSIKAEQLRELLTIPGVNWINLQFGEFTEDLQLINETMGIHVHHFPEYAAANDFYDYASLIDALDLVISVDNACAILSAALGKKVWILTPSDPYWCWTYQADNPWFCDVRYFTRYYDEDWGRVTGCVAQELQQLLKD